MWKIYTQREIHSVCMFLNLSKVYSDFWTFVSQGAVINCYHGSKKKLLEYQVLFIRIFRSNS